MAVPKMLWWLPRPRSTDEPAGGFPKNFERMLFNLYGNPAKILQPFAGWAEHGLRLDIRSVVAPDLVGDAHQLPFRDEAFDFVLLDPPYSDEYSHDLFGTGPIKRTRVLKEAVRVTRLGGHIAWYHLSLCPIPKSSDGWYCRFDRVIAIIPGAYRQVRLCTIFRKDQRLL